jgi:Skp family chaperone for outer membrane proteins
MRFLGLLLSVCGTAACLGGCGWGDQSGRQEVHGGLAVVDLDAIAKRLGRDEAMAVSLREKQTALNQQLTVLQEDLRKQLQGQKAMAGEDVNPELAAHLKLLENELNQKFGQAQLAAKASLDQHKQTLINSFREEVRPIAQAVAVDKGLSTVVSKNDSVVLAFQPDVDITEKVVEKMKASVPPKAENAAAAAAAPPAAPKARLTGN